MKRILVVGGCGFIGSHMVKQLVGQGHAVQVLDNLEHGYRDAIPGTELIEGDLGDEALLDNLFQAQPVDGVMHFASHIQVGESVTDPSKYYRNNVAATLTLLDALVRHRISSIIFSSSAAVYGEPQYLPLDEAHPTEPINPYGRSKRMIERVLEDFDRAYGLKSISLRYFNAAGADPEGALGERHQPETHLIPLVLQVASGRRGSIKVFGRDYDTPDGTCIRDYVHVHDLCRAHSLALEYLWQGGKSAVLNLGSGTGYSVEEVLEAVRRVTGASVRVEESPRRAGDPARLVADPQAAVHLLHWHPQYDDLDTMIAHAWHWEQHHFDGQPV